jgi:hypothetical protein
MAIGINGTDFPTQPSEHRWIARREEGIDGAGHPIYPAIREYELHWGVLEPTEVNTLQLYYESAAITGTLVVTLPKYADSTYGYFDYSGCTLSEPSFGKYFTEYYTDITLLVKNIRT